jgi:hypothetical protein
MGNPRAISIFQLFKAHARLFARGEASVRQTFGHFENFANKWLEESVVFYFLKRLVCLSARPRGFDRFYEFSDWSYDYPANKKNS